MPLYYTVMVEPIGIEPISTALQTAAMTTSAKVPITGLAPQTRTAIFLAPNQVTCQLAQCEIKLWWRPRESNSCRQLPCKGNP